MPKKFYVPAKPYIESHIHDGEAPLMKNNEIVISSIDPGIVNLGIYVCIYNIIKKTHKSLYLDRLCFKNSDNPQTEVLKKLIQLEEENKYFSNSHYILIEKQLSVNHLCVRMGQNLSTFFITKFQNIKNKPIIVEMQPNTKIRLLGCKLKKKNEYKKWTPKKAIELLEERKNLSEDKFIKNIKNSSKKDDKGDVICQYYAWIKIFEGEAYKPTMPKYSI